MSENKLFNIMQITTGLALLIGLVLVFVELQQAKSLTLAQLTSDGYSDAMEEFRVLMGENPAPVIAKSCFKPEELTPDEYVVLTAFYNGRVAQISRLRVLELVADFGVPWQALAEQQLIGVLDTKPGREWFQRNLYSDPDLRAVGEMVIESNPDCKQTLTPPRPKSVLNTDEQT
jgi:hypothetical protein